MAYNKDYENAVIFRKRKGEKMIDFTCCLINNLTCNRDDGSDVISEYAKNVIANEFETAVSDGYKLFLLSARDRADIEIIKLLTEKRGNFDNAEFPITIQVTVERELFTDGESGSYTADDKKYIKDSVLECNADMITIYSENNCGTKYHSINHYLISNSTRVIILRDEVVDNNEEKEKEIDDFFISLMLRKDVKKLMINEDY